MKGLSSMATHDSTTNIPYGYCQCGCGQETQLSLTTDKKFDAVRGKPNRFIHGHNARGKGRPVAERFWSHVAITANPDKCWDWQLSLNVGGYGWFNINGSHDHANRVAWRLIYGEIPDGLWVLHKCDNRACVNPLHLFLGTIQENVQDMVNKGRQAKGENNARHKLTWEQVRTIRERYAMGGISQSELARQMGVAMPTVWQIVHGNTWKK